MENRAWYLFTKRLCGELSLEEQNELNEALLESPHLQHKFELFEIWWNNPASSFDIETHTLEDQVAFEQLLESMSDAWTPSDEDDETELTGMPKKSRGMYLLAAAAVLALVVGGFWLLGNRPETVQPQPQVVHKTITSPGNTRKIQLPDGTELWLNASSSLEYSKFSPENRELYLDGEAYFDVVHNPKEPFLIHTPRGTVKVLGTVLNVRAYSNEERFETSLIHGKVEVVMNNAGRTTFNLKPYEKLVVNIAPPEPEEINNHEPASKNDGELRIETPEVQPLVPASDEEPMLETAWLYNTLAFRDETFRDVADKMEKWYGVEIRFRSKRIEQERLTGTFRQETLQQALNALQIITEFDYTLKDETIIISAK